MLHHLCNHPCVSHSGMPGRTCAGARWIRWKVEQFAGSQTALRSHRWLASNAIQEVLANQVEGRNLAGAASPRPGLLALL